MDHHSTSTEEEMQLPKAQVLDRVDFELKGQTSAYRQNLGDTNGLKAFQIFDLLSPEECQMIINDTEEHGFKPLNQEFPESYRNNQRILAISSGFVNELWYRIAPFFKDSDSFHARPLGFGNDGQWLPHRLNECVKYGKYEVGQGFKSHIDGPWIPEYDEASIYTLLIYLNDDFDGGETVFYTQDDHNADDIVPNSIFDDDDDDDNDDVDDDNENDNDIDFDAAEPTDILPGKKRHVIKPKQGSAVIFLHEILHKAYPVTRGSKYVARTEVLFHRRNRNEIINPDAFRFSSKYLEAQKIYTASHLKLGQGDIEGFHEEFLKVLKLQHEAKAIVDSKRIDNMMGIPFEIWLRILRYLSPSELAVCMQVCRDWNALAKSPSLWKSHCTDLLSTLTRIPSSLNSVIDWYLLYRSRFISSHRGVAVAAIDANEDFIHLAWNVMKTGEYQLLQRPNLMASDDFLPYHMRSFEMNFTLAENDYDPFQERVSFFGRILSMEQCCAVLNFIGASVPYCHRQIFLIFPRIPAPELHQAGIPFLNDEGDLFSSCRSYEFFNPIFVHSAQAAAINLEIENGLIILCGKGLITVTFIKNFHVEHSKTTPIPGYPVNDEMKKTPNIECDATVVVELFQSMLSSVTDLEDDTILKIGFTGSRFEDSVWTVDVVELLQSSLSTSISQELDIIVSKTPLTDVVNGALMLASFLTENDCLLYDDTKPIDEHVLDSPYFLDAEAEFPFGTRHFDRYCKNLLDQYCQRQSDSVEDEIESDEDLY